MNDISKGNGGVVKKRTKQTVLKLAEKCPLSPRNPSMCPLNPVRKRQPSTRLKWVESLKDEDLDFIIRYHKVCFKWQKAGCPAE